MGLDVFFSSLSQVEGHRSKDTPRGARVGMNSNSVPISVDGYFYRTEYDNILKR